MRDVLLEARAIVRGPRARHYGPPARNLNRIAALWSAYLEQPVAALDVCNLMVLLKVARVSIGGAYHRDTYVDVAGYAYCAELVGDQARTSVSDFPKAGRIRAPGPGRRARRTSCDAIPASAPAALRTTAKGRRKR